VSAALTGLSNVISAASVMKPKGSRSRQKDSVSPKMKHPRAKACAQKNSFTNKALPLFSLFFGKLPKRVCSAKTL
jgi:hypothetical protein